MALGFLIFLQLVLSGIANSRTIVESIPGFNGSLPFTLETGYVGVGEMEDVQLFYYFVESQRSPGKDPLMLWLTGGPGCSTLSAFFYQSGPLIFNVDEYKEGTPTLALNPNAWTQCLNIIFLDSPVGTGFSYSRTQHGYYMDDYKSNAQTYEFLTKWFKDHPEFLENELYIGGDSYSGITVPMLVQEIINGNEAGKGPFMNLQGYVLGNPWTDTYLEYNSRVPFAHRMALISDDLYQLVRYINLKHVLEPYCDDSSPRPHEVNFHQRHLKEHSKSYILSPPTDPTYCFREYGFMLSAVWANDKGVREALQVREGTKGVWERCNHSIAYANDVPSVVAYHQNLTTSSLRALIYRYVRKLKNNDFALTYATVKGAGHVAPEYKPKECYIMVDRWLAYNTL